MTETTKTEKIKQERKPHNGPHATLEAANAANPNDKRLRLFRVCWPGEQPCFCWTDGNDRAVAMVAKSKGASVGRNDKIPTSEAVSAMLTALTPETRAAILAQFSGKKAGK